MCVCVFSGFAVDRVREMRSGERFFVFSSHARRKGCARVANTNKEPDSGNAVLVDTNTKKN